MSGPFETEREAHFASLWAKQAPDRPAHAGTDMAAVNAADLLGVLAGVELGAYDRRIVGWLAGWEPLTVAVICGLIRRARTARGDGRRPGRSVTASIDTAYFHAVDAFDGQPDAPGWSDEAATAVEVWPVRVDGGPRPEGRDVRVDIGRTNIRLDLAAGEARRLAALLTRAAAESEAGQ